MPKLQEIVKAIVQVLGTGALTGGTFAVVNIYIQPQVGIGNRVDNGGSGINVPGTSTKQNDSTPQRIDLVFENYNKKQK